MRRTIFLCAIVATVCLTDWSTAHADSYYRINLRAYRRMMHHQYPGPFAERFWNFVDTRLLQPDGPADQALNIALEKLLGQLADAEAANMTVARSEPKADQDLKATEERTIAVLNQLGVAIPPKVGTAPNSPDSNGDGFDVPVTVPPEFAFPEQQP